jgi:catechol 2,3-dioxygenase-like lactoylglutathione lyase family enzyme
MNLKLSHTFLLVRDHDEALAFYRDVLGLEVRTDALLDDYRWLSVGPAGQPEVEIVLSVPGQGGQSPEDVVALRELLAKGSLNALIFRVDNCDTTFDKIRAAGAEVMQEPVDQAYGVRDCAFRDPSGNHLRFSEPIKG